MRESSGSCSPRVSAELRAKVQRLARRRGHVPNARLTALMGEVRRSAANAYRETLGIVSFFPEERPWIERPLWSHLGDVVRGAEERAQAHGYKRPRFHDPDQRSPRVSARKNRASP